MRRRITKAFLATAAAGATVTTLGLAASPAGATTGYFTPSGGTPVATNANCTVTPAPSDRCGMSGYVASATSHDFRFASALIDVPDHTGNAESGQLDPSLYVGLDASTNSTYRYAWAGVAPCTDTDDYVVPGQTFTAQGINSCPSSGWVVFSVVDEPNSDVQVDVEPLGTAMEGDGIAASVYLTPNGQNVQTVITLPDGSTFQHIYSVGDPAYSKAVALADYTAGVEGAGSGSEPAPQPANPKVRDTQFFQGRFTTVTGQQGTFTGPWTTTAYEATSNGSLPSSGTLIGQPSYLWNDGHGLNGMGSDAFGLWRYPF